jgi:hypothetical protein
VDYDYFDFHHNYKKGSGTANLDSYVNDQLKNLYLTGIGMYSDKSTFTFSADGDSM